jgi:hypothetical protein
MPTASGLLIYSGGPVSLFGVVLYAVGGVMQHGIALTE